MSFVFLNDEGEAALELAIELVESGAGALDVVEQTIRSVESNQNVKTVALGGLPNICGEMELDASIMEGQTLRSGAVGAIRGVVNPISVARKVLEVSPHEILVGDGASRFAKDAGFPVENALTAEAKAAYQDWLQKNVPEHVRKTWNTAPLNDWVLKTSFKDEVKDTAVCVVCDKNGAWASGASTSGWPFKHPGRLGDSPIIGAGHYTNSRYGAAACTCAGEMAVRLSLSRALVCYLKAGMSAEDACREGVNDIKQLAGGYIDTLVLHAIDVQGAPFAITTGEPHHYFVWHSDKPGAETKHWAVGPVACS